jgi:hypothetical protein
MWEFVSFIPSTGPTFVYLAPVPQILSCVLLLVPYIKVRVCSQQTILSQGKLVEKMTPQGDHRRQDLEVR